MKNEAPSIPSHGCAGARPAPKPPLGALAVVPFHSGDRRLHTRNSATRDKHGPARSAPLTPSGLGSQHVGFKAEAGKGNLGTRILEAQCLWGTDRHVSSLQDRGDTRPAGSKCSGCRALSRRLPVRAALETAPIRKRGSLTNGCVRALVPDVSGILRDL